jgi:ParB family chromosome partitioning protein
MATYEVDRVYHIPISDILIDETKNCRGKIAPHTLTTLARDIETVGLQQPIIVRFANEEDKTDKPLILVAGFRRTFAHKILDRPTIEGIVRKITPIEAMFINLSENLEREDLSLLQEAHAVSRFLRIGLSVQELAKKIHQPQGWIRTRKMLLELEPELQELAASKILSPQNVMDLYAIKDPKDRMLSARIIKEKREKGFQGPVKIKIKRPGEEELKKRVAPKKERPRGEMLNLMDYLEKIHFPVGFHSRILAWSAGGISDNELMHSIEVACEEKGIDFAMPLEEGIPNMRQIPTN